MKRMTSLENNRRQDLTPVAAFTALTHSLTEPKLPNGTTQPQRERNHFLQCDAFCVEYVTEATPQGERLKGISVMPAAPAGLPLGRYTFSPEPNAEVSSKVIKRLNQAHTSGDTGAVLLRDLLALEREFPAYSWRPSQSIHAEEQATVQDVTPLLPEFKDFVAHPTWLPHYGMKSHSNHETNWVAATIHPDTISCLFRTSSEWSQTNEPSILSLKLRYSGPALTPEDPPSVIGQRVALGLKAIMEHARTEGSLSTRTALIENTLKPPFLEPVGESFPEPHKAPGRPILAPQQRTLSSGAVTALAIDPLLGLAVVKVQAHSKEGASSISYHMPSQLRASSEMWMAEVSEAYRLLNAPGESMRLSGLYALRGLSATMDYKIPDIAALIGNEYYDKVLAVADQWKMVVGCETGPNISVSNMLALCDGIQQVGFILAREKRPSTIYTELLLGFAPDGSIHFSAKNDVGGAFEGRLDQSLVKVAGDRGQAAHLLVEAFGKQQSLKERRAFEEVAQVLVEMDSTGYSHALLEDNPSFCSIPSKADKDALRAYDLGGAIVRSFCSAAKIPVRASVHYLGGGACETLVAYPGAPFEMRLIIQGSKLSEVRFSGALPLHADPIKRGLPTVQLRTNLNIMDGGSGTQAAGSILLNYLRYARESIDPRSDMPLTDSEMWRVLRSIALPAMD